MKSALIVIMNKISIKILGLFSLLFMGTFLLTADTYAQRGNQDDEQYVKPAISEEEYNKLLMWIVDEKYENVLTSASVTLKMKKLRSFLFHTSTWRRLIWESI